MQNDMLKNDIAPWQEKGRWYHGVFDCATHQLKSDKTDDLLLSSNFTIMNVGTQYMIGANGSFGDESTKYVILDCVIHTARYPNVMGSGSNLGTPYIYKSGVIFYPIAVTYMSSGEVEFWCFIVKSEINV